MVIKTEVKRKPWLSPSRGLSALLALSFLVFAGFAPHLRAQSLAQQQAAEQARERAQAAEEARERQQQAAEEARDRQQQAEEARERQQQAAAEQQERQQQAEEARQRQQQMAEEQERQQQAAQQQQQAAQQRQLEAERLQEQQRQSVVEQPVLHVRPPSEDPVRGAAPPPNRFPPAPITRRPPVVSRPVQHFPSGELPFGHPPIPGMPAPGQPVVVGRPVPRPQLPVLTVRAGAPVVVVPPIRPTKSGIIVVPRMHAPSRPVVVMAPAALAVSSPVKTVSATSVSAVLALGSLPPGGYPPGSPMAQAQAQVQSAQAICAQAAAFANTVNGQADSAQALNDGIDQMLQILADNVTDPDTQAAITDAIGQPNPINDVLQQQLQNLASISQQNCQAQTDAAQAALAAAQTQ